MIGPNTAFEDEIYFQYLRDPDSVSREWREYFDENHGKSIHKIDSNNDSSNRIEEGKPENRISKHVNGLKSIDENMIPLDNIQARISENMELSTEVPTATSIRTIPVKALDENRRIINKYLLKMKRPKVSFTNILLWAVVKSLIKYPHLNDSFDKVDGKPYRIVKKSINIGLAVDVEKSNGKRLLLVPNVKNTQNFNFSEFIQAVADLIYKTRNNKIEIDDLAGTTITLTNPGMIGTTASNPRLMKGQGMIIATGSINYPTEFQAVRPEIMTSLAVSKVVTITNTYDHRIIQGAESAEFLAYINHLLIGGDHFYDQIFASLKIPFEPIRWSIDASKSKTFNPLDNKDFHEKSAHVIQLINAYRVRGHLLASINPLGFSTYYYPELDPAYYGFTIWDLDREFHADDTWEKNNLLLRDIIELLRDTYCGSTGVEYMHIQAPEKKEWIKRYFEHTHRGRSFSKNEKIEAYQKLIEAELFENYLHTKFVGHKRFSLQGSESVIVMLDKIFQLSADNDLKKIVLGMAHRGRLNVLVNNIGKDMSEIFDEFDEKIDRENYLGSGDVKYHLGDKGKYKSKDGNSIDVILAPNPSHLELVDPVIEGMARAYSNILGDFTRTLTLPVLLHGDAAFSGQGIVAETLNLSQLQGYRTAGTIHIVINNQIGFTTATTDARSSYYATDVAKMIQTPIIHVNGNDPEAILSAALFAFEYRMKFKGDVIIDLLSYRKYGHNEADEPTYTQPLLYKKIKSMLPVGEIYEQHLTMENILSKEEANDKKQKFAIELNEAFTNRTKKQKEIPVRKYKQGQIFENVKTSVSKSMIEEITKSITTIPNRFKANPKVDILMKKRAEMVDSELPKIDWSMAEALAFGTILLDGKDMRFTGQDTRRGTFSQRHAEFTDIITEEEYIPLNHIKKGQGRLRIYDSPLSEISVLGFEYGYSIVNDEALTMWEAQFGDFSNGAQAMLDQFISSAESKWNQVSNLVMLLPHGYDGQGPEHSSARLERYLQLCAEENMIVCYPTTPAQYFHLLRRQVNFEFKKPLIVMTPKSMLRNPMAVSSVKDLTSGRFDPIIDDEINDKGKIRRIILSTGKVYWDLLKYSRENKIQDTALIRIDQIYPFHMDLLNSIFAKYYSAKAIVWVQEEPQNMGAWNFVSPLIRPLLTRSQEIYYSGRKESASTATGSLKVHEKEQMNLIERAFEIE